jgi:Secretion system C-terminal sorting domain
MELAIGHLRTDRQRIVAANIDLCPLLGDKGVFLARSLAKFFSDIEYDDKAICESVGIYAKMSFGESAEFLTISPNPAYEQVTLSYTVLEDSDVEIFDLFGKLVLTEILPSAGYELVLFVDELPTGTYFVKVVHRDGTLAMVEKLIVIK